MDFVKNWFDVVRGFFPEQVPIWVKLLFWVAIALGFSGQILGYLIVKDANRSKLNDKKFYPSLWYPQMAFRVFNERKMLFPGSRKLILFKASFIIGSLLFVAWFYLSIFYWR